MKQEKNTFSIHFFWKCTYDFDHVESPIMYLCLLFIFCARDSALPQYIYINNV